MACSDGDLDRVVQRALEAEIGKGALIHHVVNWKRAYRERVLENESAVPGFVARSIQAMDDQQEPEAMPVGGRSVRVLPPAAEVLRRLYDAKLADLARFDIPAGERVEIAIDYACSCIDRCDHAPYPAGGLPRLESDLISALDKRQTCA